MQVSNNNDPLNIADKHFVIDCPYCNTHTGVSLISAPRYEYLTRFNPKRIGMGYRCDACNEPIFLKFQIKKYGNPIIVDENPVMVNKPVEHFELSYLPKSVAEDFGEALICYSQNCWNAFAAMCRRTLQSSTQELGTEGSTRVQKQIKDLHEMGVVDDDVFSQLQIIMVSGHDGAHPHLPKLNEERSAVLLELMKDALYQLFIRKAKIEEASRLRQDAIKKNNMDE